MFTPRVILYFLFLTLSVAVLGQNAAFNATTAGAAPETKAPKLEHFDPSLVDPALSPCDDIRAQPFPNAVPHSSSKFQEEKSEDRCQTAT